MMQFGKMMFAASAMMSCMAAQASNLIANDLVENVKSFVAAYNNKDLDEIMALASSDMQWLSIAGAKISVETANKTELKQAMLNYFASMPDARSVIRSVHTSGNFVYALEEAFWMQNGQEKSQCSMAVYEFEANQIKHVWYFPSHQCEQSDH